MAYNFNPAATPRIRRAAALVSGYPLTMACWINPADVSSSHYAMGVFRSAETTAARNEFLIGVTNNAEAFVQAADNSSGASWRLGTVQVGVWQHLAGTFHSATERYVYLDGAKSGISDNNLTPSNLDRTSIGLRDTASSTKGYFDGDIAEAAIWNVALSDAEIAMLAKGLSPLRVRPASLVSYVPMNGAASPVIDIVAGAGWAPSGITAASSNPRIYR